MAAFAQNESMFSGKREAGFRVVEVLLANSGVLPAHGRVAFGAIGSQPALVFIFVAGSATRGKPHPRPAQVLVGQQGSGLC
jgi:hypothetical protein